MQEQINRRLNKIASLMDRHVMQIIFYSTYLAALDVTSHLLIYVDEEVFNKARQEAERLHTYHERQLEKLQEERDQLTFSQKQEA